MCFLHYRSVWNDKNTRWIQLIFSLLLNFVCTVWKIPVLLPWDKSVLISKWPKETHNVWIPRSKTFLCDPKCYKNKTMTNILGYTYAKGVYAQKLLRTTLMSWGDTNYILPYKTNIEVVTKYHLDLNHSVYVALWLKTKFDGNHCAFVTLFVLHNLKCPGVTQNHELINLMKPLHIMSRTGSQMSVVTIYAHTISHIWRTNYSGIFFLRFFENVLGWHSIMNR